MANIQIGKYRRPGIFIEEFDQSVLSSPTVEGITNLVIGVSKKGPFNTPIRLTTIGDLETIFGQLDRGLERKGSFFHRTVSKMLETGPVFAMNLLLTDDELDRVEYKSISASSGFDNDIKREGPYRRFFDTTGFWKRDTESFINLNNENPGSEDRAFNLTNLSDRPISVFIVKSKRTGFDRTLLEWYGSSDRVPPYVNAQDYASDYLVDVVVVGGNWSNYQELAVDPRWGNYFNSSGLVKGQLRNFANDRNVNLLAYYDGLSLIPFFRDTNGTNIFIETTINRDTDRTGLFCAFNNDLVEEEFYNGKLDLIGNTIVGENEKNIEFLSYKELIAEKVRVTNTPLDLPGNVTSLLGGVGYINQLTHSFSNVGNEPVSEGFVKNSNRTAWFSEGSVFGVTGGSSTLSNTTSQIEVEYNISNGSFAVIGDQKVELPSGVVELELDITNYPASSSTSTYRAVAVLSEDGTISLNTTLSQNTNPSVSASDIVLGHLSFDIVYPGEFSNVQYTDVSVDNNGFIDLEVGTDYQVEYLGNGSIKIEFLSTNTVQNVNEYTQFRRFKAFNRLVNLLDSPGRNRMAMNLGPSTDFYKYRLENSNVSNIVTSTIENKSLVLNTTLESNLLNDVSNGYLVFYTVDNEIIVGSEGLETKGSLADLSGVGVVSKDSLLYRRFFDGVINTRDFFNTNRLYVNSTGLSNSVLGETVSVEFTTGQDAQGLTSSYAGNDYIIFETSGFDFNTEVSLQNSEQIQVPDSSVNPGVFTIVNDSVTNLDPSQLADALGYSGNFFAYQVNESVERESISNIDLIYDFNDKVYLKMYIENNSDMKLSFVDQLLETNVSINTESNNTFFIQSRKSNLKQTLEIEVPDGYEREPNKVLVNAARYTEVRVGDFLEAFVNPNEDLEIGQKPRKLTRILSKRRYSGDDSLVEIVCDARIQIYNFSGDLQTMRYVSIDNYATSYKSIPLKGFKVRKNSLPDGTEGKQNQILNLVAKGTPMFKALTNKEAIDFRYLVDSFGLGLTERSKQQLVDICGDRLDAFGFINMPSLRSFKNSSSPSFTDNEGVLQTSFMAQGGDPESNPAFLYSFGEGAGTTTVGYFTPYLNVNDNGRPVDVPPAAYVATTYMRKHISNITSMTPWTIAAGVTNGRITNINGVEMDFTPEDIEFLNGAQMNPIVFKRNRGHVIETENTAQTLFNSALSFIHVREVLIELERELASMLLEYQWKYNTPDVRAEIKLRADVICETYVSKNGLFNYFNKMDDENNTPEIIDNQIGVLDTYVEPIRGMGIIVNNITILRTGAISAGGFINS